MSTKTKTQAGVTSTDLGEVCVSTQANPNASIVLAEHSNVNQNDAQTPRKTGVSRHDFFLMDNALATDYVGDLSGRALKVYTVLAYYADAHTGTCYPGIKKLAELTKMSDRNVQRGINELEKYEMITVTPRKDACGDATSNLYTIVRLYTSPKSTPIPSGGGDESVTTPGDNAVGGVVTNLSPYQYQEKKTHSEKDLPTNTKNSATAKTSNSGGVGAFSFSENTGVEALTDTERQALAAYRLPISGKHKNKTLAEIWEDEPTYLSEWAITDLRVQSVREIVEMFVLLKAYEADEEERKRLQDEHEARDRTYDQLLAEATDDRERRIIQKARRYSHEDLQLSRKEAMARAQDSVIRAEKYNVPAHIDKGFRGEWILRFWGGNRPPVSMEDALQEFGELALQDVKGYVEYLKEKTEREQQEAARTNRDNTPRFYFNSDLAGWVVVRSDGHHLPASMAARCYTEDKMQALPGYDEWIKATGTTPADIRALRDIDGGSFDE